MSDLLVLCYHALSPTWQADLSVTPEDFERQVRHMLDGGWHATSFTEAVLRPRGRRTLAITFDDAFASVRAYAAPTLERLGVPATVFAPTAFMGGRTSLSWPGIEQWGDGPHAHELTAMSWDDLRALADLGWEVGSHTRTHPHLTRLDDAELELELGGSRDECARELGPGCNSIAYPYGDVDERVAASARRLGYVAGAALGRSLRGVGPHRHPRVGVYNGDARWRFLLKVARPIRALRGTGIWKD